jgi:hypothetical protein
MKARDEPLELQVVGDLDAAVRRALPALAALLLSRARLTQSTDGSGDGVRQQAAGDKLGNQRTTARRR